MSKSLRTAGIENMAGEPSSGLRPPSPIRLGEGNSFCEFTPGGGLDESLPGAIIFCPYGAIKWR